MSRGKYLSLEESRKKGSLEAFVKQHPSTGDEVRFDRLLDAMAKKPESDDQTYDLSHRDED